MEGALGSDCLLQRPRPFCVRRRYARAQALMGDDPQPGFTRRAWRSASVPPYALLTHLDADFLVQDASFEDFTPIDHWFRRAFWCNAGAMPLQV